MDIKKSFRGWLREVLSDKPDTNEISVGRVWDRYSEYPSNGLTPESLARIFKEADAGEVMSQMELFEEMEEKDPHLFAQMQTRKNAVTGLGYKIIASSADEADKRVAEFTEKVINEIEGFLDILFDLLDAIGKGIAVSEIIWAYKNGRVVVADIKYRHQKRLCWDMYDNLKIRTEEHPEGMLLPKHKFIVHKYKARSGHPARAGILRVAAWMYLFKNYDVKDWVRFCEIFGMPVRLGKYNPGASEEDKAALMQALVQLGSDAAGILPEGTTIELSEGQKTTSVDLYERLARYCDEQTSKAVLGQTLTSDTGSSGSYAQSKTHNEVRHDLTVADCKALAGTLKRDLIKPLILFNFGADCKIPDIQFDCSEPEDLKVEAEILDTLVNKIGLKVAEQYVYEKFGIPQPGEEEIILAGQTAPMQVSDEVMPMKILKDDKLRDSQLEIDKLVEKGVELSQPMFKKMYKPLEELLEGAEDLQELKEQLGDKKVISGLFKDMDTLDFEELMQKSMMAAELQGRVIEHE